MTPSTRRARELRQFRDAVVRWAVAIKRQHAHREFSRGLHDVDEETLPAAAPPAATAPAAAPAAAAPPSSEAQQLADMKEMFEQGLIPSREIYEDKVRQILCLR